MVFQRSNRVAWSAERAYEKAFGAGWLLFFIAVPAITFATGCMGCIFASGNRRNLMVVVMGCFAFVLTHLIFIVGVSFRKRWGILGLLILGGLEILVLFIWMILLVFNLGWSKEWFGSLGIVLVVLAVSSVMVLVYWEIIRATMATRHAILEGGAPGFDVILKTQGKETTAESVRDVERK